MLKNRGGLVVKSDVKEAKAKADTADENAKKAKDAKDAKDKADVANAKAAGTGVKLTAGQNENIEKLRVAAEGAKEESDKLAQEAKEAHEFMDNKIRNSKGKPFNILPVMIKAELIMTKHAGKFMQTVAEIVSESETDIANIAKAHLDPATKRAQENEDAVETYENALAVMQADNLVDEKEAALSEVDSTDRSGYIRARNALREAKMAANFERRKQGLAEIHTVGVE